GAPGHPATPVAEVAEDRRREVRSVPADVARQRLAGGEADASAGHEADEAGGILPGAGERAAPRREERPDRRVIPAAIVDAGDEVEIGAQHATLVCPVAGEQPVGPEMIDEAQPVAHRERPDVVGPADVAIGREVGYRVAK